MGVRFAHITRWETAMDSEVRSSEGWPAPRGANPGLTAFKHLLNFSETAKMKKKKRIKDSKICK